MEGGHLAWWLTPTVFGDLGPVKFRMGQIYKNTSTSTGTTRRAHTVSAVLNVMFVVRVLAGPIITSFLLDTGVAAPVINDAADHLINATESAAVAFTFSGLSAGAAGTFTDVASHEVVVNVDATGSYPADLSTLADGAITSSLSATNAFENILVATGDAATLDTDSALTPSLSVSVLDPTNVVFTVSGLENDYSGTVTFTDATGKSDVVPIGSDGTYSANPSNLANGTLTYLMTVSDPAGNVINVDPTVTLGDGSASAPAGTPQDPNLLSGYAVRPPWMVAAVDYAVGINAGTALKNPSTINIAGTTIDSTNKVVYVDGNNITLNGYNFDGWLVDVRNGANNTTITNNDFTGGFLRYEPGSSNGTVEYNLFNQAGTVPDTAPFIAFGGGTFTVEYNELENSYHMAAQFPVQTGAPQTIIFQYNLINNAGEGYVAGAHGDWIQIFGDTVNDAQINYNTVIQNGYATQGFSTENTGQTYNNISVSNNTIVTANGGTSYIFLFVRSYINGTATVANNYIDPRGVAYDVLLTNSNIAGPYNGNIVTSNDVNMVTGAYIYPPFGGAGMPPLQ